MRNTVLASIGLGAVLTLAWFVSAPLSGQAPGGTTKEDAAAKYEAPRTSWGDPDLQGQWNSQTSTPLERPRSGALAEKDSLSEEEAESIESANLARADGPPAPGDPGTYNSFWFDRGKGLSRTSLIIDPPDGRVPAYTPAAEQRLAAERAERAMICVDDHDGSRARGQQPASDIRDAVFSAAHGERTSRGQVVQKQS